MAINGGGGSTVYESSKVDVIFVFVAQNFLNGTSFELSPAPHMFHCRYERKLFYEQIFTRKTFLDVYKYMCLKWFIGIISVPIVMPCDLFRNSSLCYIICNFSIGYIRSNWTFTYDVLNCSKSCKCLWIWHPEMYGKISLLVCSLCQFIHIEFNKQKTFVL